MTIELYLAYVLACIVVVIVPGPSVTVIIANSLSAGTRAGLLNVAGTQAGLAIILIVLIFGLASVMSTMAVWFDWVRIAGALYLIWLGYKLFTANSNLNTDFKSKAPKGGYFLQGLLVIMSNPKALLFFGAFIPQFVDPNADYVIQVAYLGATFMLVATILDGGYAILAGKAGGMLSANRVNFIEKTSGGLLILGGLWLAFTRKPA